MAVVLLLLVAYPGYLLMRSATRDPGINSLNTLDLPAWAAGEMKDEEYGSRWCIRECRFRERTLTSQRGPEETAQVYEQVLADAGWDRWHVQPCPGEPVPGFYTCWKRDEYTLDLWVRDPSCAFDPLRRRPTVAPAATPSAAPEIPPLDDCAGSVITIKMRNGISDPRIREAEEPPANPASPVPGSGSPATPDPSATPGPG